MSSFRVIASRRDEPSPMRSLFDLNSALFFVILIMSSAFATWISVDTIRTIWPIVSPLPWFDDWATYDLYTSWLSGERDLLSALFSQTNEHRILFPRLIFFLDDYVCHGQGRLEVVLIFLFQIAHATLLSSMISRCRQKFVESLPVACVIFVLMLSLRQSENFISGFQIQFIMVVAAATLSFYSLSLSMERHRAGQPIPATLIIGLLAAAVSAFSMANGLLTAIVMAILAVLGRMRPIVPILCVVWGLALISIYFFDYRHDDTGDRRLLTVFDILPFVEYVAAYLGGILTTQVVPAIAIGFVGLLATVIASWQAWRIKSVCPSNLALLGVMLFCGLTAMVTGYGRFHYGINQALQSRYATISAVFWSAHIVYWGNRSSEKYFRTSTYRAGAILTILILIFVVKNHQDGAKEKLYQDYFYQNDATNLLALGLDDPQVINRVAWSDADVQRLTPLMKQDHISIFSLPAVEAIGRPIDRLGEVAPPGACSGQIRSAVPDAALGQNAVRLYGVADGGAKKIRRVLLTDGNRDVIGLASIVRQAGRQAEWRGYAVAPPDTTIVAFAQLDGPLLCPLSR